jgi:hypothetical protein
MRDKGKPPAKLPRLRVGSIPVPQDQLATITLADMRRILSDTLEAFGRGEITAGQLEATTRDCRRITRELSQAASLVVRALRLSQRLTPKGNK